MHTSTFKRTIRNSPSHRLSFSRWDTLIDAGLTKIPFAPLLVFSTSVRSTTDKSTSALISKKIIVISDSMHNSHKNPKRYPVRGVDLLPVRRELILWTSSCSSILASFTTPMFFCTISAARKGHLEPTAWPAGGVMWPDGNLSSFFSSTKHWSTLFI